MRSASLSNLKRLKDATGGTLNDVVMAISAGALREYLLRHDALPDRPLRAMVPVSIRTGEEEDTEVGFPGADHHIAERELPMRIAMGLLALGAIGLGALQIPGVTSAEHKFLEPTFEDSRYYDAFEPSASSAWSSAISRSG